MHKVPEEQSASAAQVSYVQRLPPSAWPGWNATQRPSLPDVQSLSALQSPVIAGSILPGGAFAHARGATRGTFTGGGAASSIAAVESSAFGASGGRPTMPTGVGREHAATSGTRAVLAWSRRRFFIVREATLI